MQNFRLNVKEKKKKTSEWKKRNKLKTDIISPFEVDP